MFDTNRKRADGSSASLPVAFGAQVDDLRAAQLSSELAEKISESLVFPGQIKVTVIRELTAVAVAN